ncbi:hypothetical protein ACT3SP_11670 [Brachybacterium sp. AOP43-C2-M15]|uniref:hypothetical protein n=1 Tax=Brachybacterium sp. AOP43-C2-M15 TaxID=3457661 RepID=UPI0040336AF1
MSQRERDESLAVHRERSRRAAALLEQRAPSSVHRITTDSLEPSDVARRIAALLDWD